MKYYVEGWVTQNGKRSWVKWGPYKTQEIADEKLKEFFEHYKGKLLG